MLLILLSRINGDALVSKEFYLTAFLDSSGAGCL
jgi:hypothetical protein